MANHTPAQDYRRLSCGCCTGRAHDAVPGLRVDYCICWIHEDTPRGKAPRTCRHHDPAPPAYSDVGSG